MHQITLEAGPGTQGFNSYTSAYSLAMDVGSFLLALSGPMITGPLTNVKNRRDGIWCAVPTIVPPATSYMHGRKLWLWDWASGPIASYCQCRGILVPGSPCTGSLHSCGWEPHQLMKLPSADMHGAPLRLGAPITDRASSHRDTWRTPMPESSEHWWGLQLTRAPRWGSLLSWDLQSADQCSQPPQHTRVWSGGWEQWPNVWLKAWE